MRLVVSICLTLLLALSSGDAWASKKKKKGGKAHTPPKAAPAPAPVKAAEKAPEPKPVAGKKGDKGAAPEPRAAAGGEVSKDVIKRESKIEFDERVVQGQRAAGAVYLFQRAESQFTSLVQTPDSFRQRTIGSVFGDTQ